MTQVHRAIGAALLIAGAGVMAPAAAPAQPTVAPAASDQVEMEYMTFPEVYDAIHRQGKTTAIVFNGGTEQRGPHAVLGGHTFMARAIAVEVARRLGNALVAPVLPVGSTSLFGPKFPGGIGLPLDVYERVHEAMVESLITGGFKTIVLMGDHGTGQRELAKVADAMDAKHRAAGARVVYSEDAYEKAREVFFEYAKGTMKEGFAYGTHAGLYDTSMLLYLQPRPEAYVRNNYRTVKPNPAPPPSEGRTQSSAQSENGISGDPRFATPELGKKMMEIKVSLAVEEIRRKLGVTSRP